jgi:uncharacterized membrane protein YdbT with pleckstrin-like domain
MSWRGVILDTLRIPQAPAPPPGSPPIVFRAAPNYFKLRLLQWGITQLLALFGLCWAVWFMYFFRRYGSPPVLVVFLEVLEVLGFVVLTLRFAIGLMLVHLDYELRWYMLSDRAIRIHEGIANVREKTMTLANIQNISIRQGPLQRFLGIADLEVKTAGGGGAGDSHKKGSLAEPMHVGYFRGVANAEEIRDLVREGVRRQRDAGLGDPDEAHAPVPADDVSAAVAELLVQARALRSTVGSSQ